jgi:hypothetical protein
MKYLEPQNLTSTGLESNKPPTELAMGVGTAAAAAHRPHGRRHLHHNNKYPRLHHGQLHLHHGQLHLDNKST